MIDYVRGVGPISICIDASNWNTYTTGVMTSCGRQANHCVQIVGVNAAEGYWKIRNNWGIDWGESGYMRLATGQVFPSLKLKNFYQFYSYLI
jgi:cathepsin F/cysteine peptidase B